MTFRIPNTVRLPFGYVVKVRFAPASLLKILECEDCDGLWDETAKTIFIRASLSITRQRYIFMHELLHAVHDWQHKYMDAGIAKN